MRKGITPVIAVVLLLMITIAIIGFAFAFFTGMFDGIMGDVGESIEKTTSNFGKQLKIESGTINTIYLILI